MTDAFNFCIQLYLWTDSFINEVNQIRVNNMDDRWTLECSFAVATSTFTPMLKILQATVSSTICYIKFVSNDINAYN
jgi:hypothetical protein